MNNQDSTEKDAKAPIDVKASATPEDGTTDSTERELTDAELAAIAGGKSIGSIHIIKSIT